MGETLQKCVTDNVQTYRSDGSHKMLSSQKDTLLKFPAFPGLDTTLILFS